MQGVHYMPGHELDKLLVVFPDLRNQIVGKNVVDFACGWGYQCVALVRAGAKLVLGIEINESAVEAANRLAAHHKLAGQVSVMREIPPDFRADIIVSRNGFEHFLEPDRILLQMRSALSPGGKIFIAFAPPWNAPWGAQMAYFCRLPWVHLVFSEKTVMDVRRVSARDARHPRPSRAGSRSRGCARFDCTVGHAARSYRGTRAAY